MATPSLFRQGNECGMRRRAMVVRDYLVQHFKLDDTRIKTAGLGKSQDVSERGRVKILVYPAGTNTSQNNNPSSMKQ